MQAGGVVGGPLDPASGKEADGEDVSHIRTEDIVCLACTSGDASRRGYLAATGFGSQVCHLAPEPRSNEPNQLWKCTFSLEDALSVHAMYTQGMKAREKKQGNRRILMYGQAILLRHMGTKKLLRCLSSSPTGDKLAYEIGFAEQPDNKHVDESCWFIVRPASKQRSEGEKVRAADDVFLVNVANERFLSARLSVFNTAESDAQTAAKSPVLASFVQCVWTVNIVLSGSAKEAAIGYVNGGDVVRLVHRHGAEDALAVGARESDKNVSVDRSSSCCVCYEDVSTAQLRSLWRVELFKMSFGGGFTRWGQPFRLRHIVSGKFLGLKEVTSEGCGGGGGGGGGGGEGKVPGHQQYCVGVVDASEASVTSSAFYFSNCGDDPPLGEGVRMDSMGSPQIEFGDSEVFLLHTHSRKIVGCAVSERHRRRQLRTGRRVLAQGQPHQSFMLTIARASEEQAKAAAIVNLTEDLMRNYVHKTLLCCERRSTTDHLTDSLANVLSNLCYYFHTPDLHSLSHDDYQQQLVVLRERQNLFQKQGMLVYVFHVIIETGKSCQGHNPATGHIHHKLYELMAAMIRGNHANCREFATTKWLEVFIGQLHMPAFTHDVLELIQCLLDDSPEVLNLITEKHVEVIVGLLGTNGRDAKVMKLLSSLCVCHGVAMRDKQRLICQQLYQSRDLLLHTSLQDNVHSVHANISVGVYRKWYYEVEVTQLLATPQRPHPLLRVGWSHTLHFQARPTSNGFSTSCGAVGDDLFSFGYNGTGIWIGGHCLELASPAHPRLQRQSSISVPDSVLRGGDVPAGAFSVGDVVGCCLDIDRGEAWFTKNGSTVPGKLRVAPDIRELMTPAISFSAGVSVVLSLGGPHGKFHYNPPPDFSGLHEAVAGDYEVRLLPFLCPGVSAELLTAGPSSLSDHQSFIPAPIDTSQVSLPDPVLAVREQLALNIHEVWARNKIEAGFSFGAERNDHLRHNPCLCPFAHLSQEDSRYDYEMALDTLRTLVALGYLIDAQDDDPAPPTYVELPHDRYRQSNGYVPRPLDLEGVWLEESLETLVERLAENAHNVWAAQRIKEGWTYGLSKDAGCKRSPLLLPYSKLDGAAKKSNRDTAYESVRTLSALGCSIQPPSSLEPSPISFHHLSREYLSTRHVRTRTFRGQSCYAVKMGKWYYEIKLLTDDALMRVGWATPTFPAGELLGVDQQSYAFDGYLACKWHNGSESFGQRWSAGDVVGCLLDLDHGTMSFSLNGDLLQDTFENTLAFEGVVAPQGLVPAVTLSAGQRAKFNFGKSEEPLLRDYSDLGYQPICSPASLHYNIPLWYSSQHGAYKRIGPAHPRLAVARKCGERGRFARETTRLSVSAKDWDYSKHMDQECLRLNVGVTFDLGPPSSGQKSSNIVSPRGIPLSPTSPAPQPPLPDMPSPLRSRVSFAAIVPVGQDPALVFLGWTSTGFKYLPGQFGTGPRDLNRPRPFGQTVGVVSEQQGPHGAEESGELVTSFSSAFLVCLADLLPPCSSCMLETSHRVSCILDLTSGQISFTATPVGTTLSERPRPLFLSVTSRCKLYPTVVVTPSRESVVDFDLSPEIGCRALSAGFVPASSSLRPPPCPPRVRLLALAPSRWVRQPTETHFFSSRPGTDGALQVVAGREPSSSVFCTLPEEGVVINVLEVAEKEQLLSFYIHTLQAYSAVSSHGNEHLAQKVGVVLSPQLLLACLHTQGLRFNLRAAYFDLLAVLHLEQAVQTQLMMRGEFILPLSDIPASIPLFPTAPEGRPRPQPRTQPQLFRLSSAPLPGRPCSQLQATISHNITSAFATTPFLNEEQYSVIEELKQLVFSDLEYLLTTRYHRGILLPCEGSHEIVVPLLTVLDHLLVMGALGKEEDLQRLLAILDPVRFPTETANFSKGLISSDVAENELVKLSLCRLLQHLCDCQVQHRVEAVLAFAQSFVGGLSSEQRERHGASFHKRPKEFRSPPEKQMENMLQFKHGPHADCHTSAALREDLRSFHAELRRHCGCVDPAALPHRLDDMSVREKLEQLLTLALAPEKTSGSGNGGGDSVTSLQQLITETMIAWGSLPVLSSALVQELFLLLHRQFDEVAELVRTLRRTYIVEVGQGGEARYDIPNFRRALGALRLLLRIGMGRREEKLLRTSLRTIAQSDLFYCHAPLLRSLGVHSTVLALMDSYLGISSGAGTSDNVITLRRKKKMAMSKEGLPAPVEECCRFLCTFARISAENQRALFDHIGPLLANLDQNPGLMTSGGCTPLDVATAIIKDNHEIALALEQSHLERVVSLLVATTTISHGAESTELTEDNIGLVPMGSVCYEWAPNGGEKCLEFLQSAVWVDNEQIQENASVIVRLLIHNSECLGRALAGEALGLQRVYEEAIDQLDDTPEYLTPIPNDSLDETAPPLRHRDSSSSSSSAVSRRSSGSFLNVTLLSTRMVLSYYTALIRLLASCAPGDPPRGHAPPPSQLKRSTAERTLNILCNLVRAEEVVGILALPYSRDELNGLSPPHKEAALLFLDRVYGMASNDLLLRLLSDAFLPDLKLALRLNTEPGERDGLTILLNRYLCLSVFPYLARHAHSFRQVFSSVHVVLNLVTCALRYSSQPALSASQLDELASFFTAFTLAVHPRATVNYLPRIIVDFSSLQQNSSVPLKMLTVHYEHYARFYGNGMLSQTALGVASTEDKVQTALVIMRLLNTLAAKLPTSLQLLRSSVSCLRAISSALPPDCTTPSLAQRLAKYGSTSTTFEPQPADISGLQLNAEMEAFVREFAAYQHDGWVHEKVSVGWHYGPVESEKISQHPNLKPFNELSQQDRNKLLQPAEEAVKFVLTRCYAHNKVRKSDKQSVPLRQKMTCLRRSKKRPKEEEQREHWHYEPEVMDLSRVETPIFLLVMSEHMAENAHNRWARALKDEAGEVVVHPLFVPYELLDEPIKENYRSYALELLRYLRVLGYDMARSQVRPIFSSQLSYSRAHEGRFCLQLFDKFLELLSQDLSTQFYLKVLFPVMAQYLRKHADYFMPSSCHRNHSVASSCEKMKIIEMFCRVMEFCRQRLEQLFSSPLPSPGRTGSREGGREGGSDRTTAKALLSLVEAIVPALDARSLALKSPSSTGAGGGAESVGFVSFFEQAAAGLHRLARHMTRPPAAPPSFQYYVLHLLVPSLTELFAQLGTHGAGVVAIVGKVRNYSLQIFKDLVEMAMASPVFEQCTPLVDIGQCMGAFTLAYPEPFLETSSVGFSLPSLLDELDKATLQGVTGGNVLFVVDTIVPVLSSYLSRWWTQQDGDLHGVGVAQVDEVLNHVLSLQAAHFGHKNVTWFSRLIDTTLLLSTRCSLSLLASHLTPLLLELRERAISLWQDEQFLAGTQRAEDAWRERMEALTEDYQIFVRDLMAVLPYAVSFLRSHSDALRHRLDEFGLEPSCPLFESVADIFHCWFSSKHFRRELQAATQFLLQHCRTLQVHPATPLLHTPPCKRTAPREGGKPQLPNFILVSLELLLPLVEASLHRDDRVRVDHFKMKLEERGVTPDDVRTLIWNELEEQAACRGRAVAHHRRLVHQLSKRFISTVTVFEKRAQAIFSLATIRHRIHQLDHPSGVGARWWQLLTAKRRRAVIDCFLAVPFFQLKKHRALNLFLETYCSTWLGAAEHGNHQLLTERLLDRQDYLQSSGQALGPCDPLTQLLTMFRRASSASLSFDRSLYSAYMDVLSKSVIGFGEEDEETVDDNPTRAFELYHQRRAELIVKQKQLARRGAPAMVLLVITACNGCMSKMVYSTLRLGIAVLKEGNEAIQHEMLEQLYSMDVGFLSSVAQLIASCSVLNWSAFERFNKAETIHRSTNVCSKVLPDSSFTVTLFRFLQLLCEGHNEAFQNYLRTQAGNTTTVNIILCSVDYLLRLQESIGDFYWHYADQDTVDLPGRENFFRAFKVTKQVFRTLTEYIQGPCVQNQETLARSRLWDAVSGFLQVFAALERQLYRDTSQVELLRELLSLQEELYILLLSMLEGSAMSSNIGRLMVDMLVDSAHNIEDIMGFFSIFVKLKDVTTSKAFKDYDLNKDGTISYREFEMAMESQQRYSKEEITYLMDCADVNKDGLLDYMEFTERFHQPAENIGFHLCVLLVHLSEHLPHDTRLERFRRSPQARSLMDHFRQNMGCIEILGKSRGIERVYFEVRESRLRQWEEVQIQESRRLFLHSVEMGSQKNKLQGFINFCEDTIFEMDYADTISGTEETEREVKARQHRSQHNRELQHPTQPFVSRVHAGVYAFRLDLHLRTRAKDTIVLLWLLITTWLLSPLKHAVGILRNKVSWALSSLRNRLSPPPPKPPLPRFKLTKRASLRLKIPAPNPSPPRSSLSAQLPARERREEAGVPTRRFSFNTPTLEVDDGLRSTRSCSFSHTPRQFNMRHLKLAYDRSGIKPPSHVDDRATPSPSPQANQHQQPPANSQGDSYMPQIRLSTRGWSAFFARNYYRINMAELVITFLINILLLTVHNMGQPSLSSDSAPSWEDQGSSPLLLPALSSLHFLLSCVLILSYWHLKVPVIIFKREKQVARQLECQLMWVQAVPVSLAERWDGLVVGARSFPRKYWDKQVKERVRNQFEGERRAEVTRLLGLKARSKYQEGSKWEACLETLQSLVDVRYWLWVLGVVMSNLHILYHFLYCGMSLLGLHWSSFLFSMHLLDLVMNFKMLRTVMRSVLHNGKQLTMTLLMTCVIIYLYTVVAFNFFQRFYRQQSPDGQERGSCDSMARCFVFHVDKGLRSGGGIADVLEPASGDPQELLRFIFDNTFFFVVIVILLAIIQGLIIDAFGELRDREDSITSEMLTKCFVCGLPKAEFDHIPHGFDNHINRDHSMSHYMFFLLYLIKKRESEFSGQESYVWDMYLRTEWDFFPVGDCFRKQEERKEQAKLRRQLPHPRPVSPRLHTPSAARL